MDIHQNINKKANSSLRRKTISEEYSEDISSENECKMDKIKAKEQFNFGTGSKIKIANIDLDKLDRLIITPKEKYR
jgi:hypothetical protein